MAKGQAFRQITVSMAIVCLGASCVARAQSLADTAKEQKKAQAAQTQPVKSFTNEDVAKAKGVEPMVKVEVSATPADRSGGATPEQMLGQTPYRGDETYWRKRAEDAARAKSDAQSRVDQNQSALNMMWTQFYGMDDPAARDDLRAKLDQVTKDLEKAQDDLQKANEALDNLPDEARKAGALPGWIRLD